MDLNTLFQQISIGGVLSIIVIVSTLIQISPLKINPWCWIGDQLNRNIKDDMNKRIDEVQKEVKQISENQLKQEKKLDEHIATSFRTKIINFQDDIVNRGMKKTHRQWREILRACKEYEEYIEANHLINGDGTEAIEFIRAEYQQRCKTGGFLVINKGVSEDETKA